MKTVKTLADYKEKMIMTELVSTPEEAINLIHGDAYNIKIKCLACSESEFIPYVPPIIHEGKLMVGEHSFPLRLVEMVTFRWKNEFGKWESRYKVESSYFRQFLNNTARQELERMGF